MVREVWADPPKALAAAADLEKCGEKIKGAFRAEGDVISAADRAQPWGDDDIGGAFVKNYKEPKDTILEVWPILGDAVKGMGTGVRAAVTGERNQDAGNAAAIKGSHTGGPKAV
jgi:hypothetical protein